LGLRNSDIMRPTARSAYERRCTIGTTWKVQIATLKRVAEELKKAAESQVTIPIEAGAPIVDAQAAAGPGCSWQSTTPTPKTRARSTLASFLANFHVIFKGAPRFPGSTLFQDPSAKGL
jgi:hypothetical protein